MASTAGYLSEDTVAAISTSVGGAIAIVRVSGPRAFNALHHITRTEVTDTFEPRKMNRAFVYLENGERLDDALFVRFVHPLSYTGEDLVEFHLHGGGFIAHRLMETLISYGLRQALPGEFSFRAVKNGKMTLFQAQAVADLISASNDNAVSLALEKLTGSQNALLQDLAAGLRNTAVLGEVGIDFADQDVEEVSLPELKKRLRSTELVLEKLKSSFSRGLRLQEGVSVAFVGLPNAGKSSFFNSLLGEDRSIVSELAGTTRDTIREKLTLRGKSQTVTLRLEDTAGLRKAENPIEKMGISRTHRATQDADLVLFLVDPSDSLLGSTSVEEEWRSLSSVVPISDKTIGIFTKSDLIDHPERAERLTHFRNLGISTWIWTSSHSGEGISEAIQQIVEYCEHWTKRDKGELILTRIDHFQAVRASLEHLERARSATEIDLFASDIRQALYALDTLIGETLPDDILGKIFSDFCIGK